MYIYYTYQFILKDRIPSVTVDAATLSYVSLKKKTHHLLGAKHT